MSLELNLPLVIIGSICVLFFSILGGALANVYGKGTADCNCITKTDYGFQVFGIVWLITSIAFIVMLMIWGHRLSY